MQPEIKKFDVMGWRGWNDGGSGPGEDTKASRHRVGGGKRVWWVEAHDERVGWMKTK